MMFRPDLMSGDNALPRSGIVEGVFMQPRCIWIGILLLTGLHGAASAECPDQATARRGYSFQNEAGGVATVQFKGTDQSVLFQAPGRETVSEYANDGQVYLRTTTTVDGKIAHQIFKYVSLPDRLDAVGQSTEYFGTLNTDSSDGRTIAPQYIFSKRKVIETERVAVGDCSYDTLVFLNETMSVSAGGEMQKAVTRTNWSPILGWYLKSETTTYTPPNKDPVVRKTALVRVSL